MSGPLDALFGFFTEGIAAGAEGRADSDSLAFNFRRLAEARRGQEGRATDALNLGAMEAGRIRQKGSDIAAQQAVAFASNNLDASSGTPAALVDASRMYAELDASTAMNNARRVALGHKEAAREYEREGQRLGIEARQRATARDTRVMLSWGKAAASMATSGMNGGGM